jgi:hypothetical protein
MDRLGLERFSAALLEWAVLLLPLLIYLVVLAIFVNRRRNPVVVSGVANQLALWLALAGFLLLGPFTWPLHFFRSWGLSSYVIAYVAYVFVLLSLVLRSLRRQRTRTYVYNVHPAQLAEALQETLHELKAQFVATPGRIAFAQPRCVLDVESSFLWHNVTLRWEGAPGELRDKIEAELNQRLRDVTTEQNPASLLLLLMATVVLFVMLFAFAVQGLGGIGN